MPRPPRIDIEDGWHHVMNRGAGHADVFFNDGDRVEFGSRLSDIHDRFDVEIHAYCLMDNHYHLLVHCPLGGLSASMQHLGSLYTRHVNDRVGRDGALFRGRFHSRLITSDAHLLAACRYIHRNALDLPGVSDLGSYRWSSHRTYLGQRRSPTWMRTNAILDHFAGDVASFDTYVRSEDTRPARRNMSVEELRDVFESVVFVLAEKGFDDDHRSGALARSMVLAWVSEDSQVDSGDVMAALGIDGRAALRSARSRARKLISEQPALAAVIDAALGLVPSDVPSQRGSDPCCDGYRAARAAS